MEILQPKLRFQEFKPNWKKTDIKNVLKIGSGKDYKHLEKGDIPVFGTGGLMTYVNSFLYDGETVCIGRKGTIDKPMYFNGKIWTVDTLFYTHSFINSTPMFIYYIFQNINWKKHNEASGVPSLSKTTIEKISIIFPGIEEQTKITNFLSEIDEKINLLKENKSLLEEYKKGIMQKIFNRDLRFQDDNGEEFEGWEEKSLGTIADFYKGKGLPKSELIKNGDFKCIHYGELFTKYQELINEIYSSTNYNDKPFLSITNDVLMPTSDVTPNGLATASCLNEDNVILGGDVLIIRQKVKILNGIFLAFYIKQNRNKVMKLVSGSTVYHLYGSDMKNLSIKYPSYTEQTKIANFLSSIDEKIELVNTQIQDTQKYKKGLLQQMFI
jgi:type I restriction enzyme S subunit